MNGSTEYCREQASIASAEAEAAKLDNVRERCLRSVAAWTAMADRAERTQAQRAQREAESLERVAIARLGR